MVYGCKSGILMSAAMVSLAYCDVLDGVEAIQSI